MTEETTTTTATIIPDLLDCDALMLSSYLLHHRFDGDAMATATFLLEATSTLPNAEEISAHLMGTDQGGEEDTKKPAAAAIVNTDDLGNVLAEECTVSMTTPRGKFQMTLYEKGIRCVNAKNQILLVLPQYVERLVMFPKPEDCRATSKPSGGNMVLLCLDSISTLLFNDKALPQVCFQLPNKSPNDTTSWIDLFCLSLSLSKKQVASVQNPKSRDENKRHAFKSHDEGTTSSTTASMPFVQCYHGVKDGVLYPMQEGLLFFKYVCFDGHVRICFYSLTHSSTTTTLYIRIDHPCFCIVRAYIRLRVDVVPVNHAISICR